MKLSATNLTKSYTGHTVLDIQNAQFGGHGIEGLIGPNGAGKSTLLGCLTRRIAATTGDVRLEDDAGTSTSLMGVQSYEVARKGLVKTNQRIQNFDSLTIRDSLRMAATPSGKQDWRSVWRLAPPDDVLEAEIDVLLSRFPFSDPDGYAMSGGEKKLLDILRCVIVKPKMLLMDEPTAGLPDEITKDVMKLMQEMVDAGEMTVVIIEHDLDLIWANCSYVHFLSEGSILFEGKPDAVKKNRVVAEKYMGV
ncbi:ATP-binding cassette domain-containing protein [Yoonia sp. BS5-3]|uniref:ATP-binding cassette domain-containing protein n=1 Tax=Yoonia phaeophyticola TaxID=3137369 RepID=A0ABZ2V8I4_9RHOB